MIDRSTLFIVNDVETTTQEIISTLPIHSTRVIKNEDEDKNEFQLKQATKAIKEAYISENETKYILLCGNSFRIEAQNSLLKVLEEPPSHIIFIIITTSKNSILPTILSRVQLKYKKTKKDIEPISLNLSKLELKDVYSFLKQNQRVSKKEAKNIIESILFTIHTNKIDLTKEQLECFSKSMKLLELNSRPINILTTLLLTIMLKNK
jgi:DNA polymerase-3 subunit delta'